MLTVTASQISDWKKIYDSFCACAKNSQKCCKMITHSDKK